MRVMLAVVAALSLLVGVVGDAGAETSAKKHKRYVKRPPAVLEYATARSTRPDSYVERDATKLPFGSAIWWDQMQREGRLGGETR